MKISQKISLSFAGIFALVFVLGAVAVVSLRQIYKGVYESLRLDLPAIHESAYLGVLLAHVQKKSEETPRSFERFSSYIVTAEEQELLQQIKEQYRRVEELSKTAEAEQKEWEESYRQLLRKREGVLTQISLLAQLEEDRLEKEKDLFLAQTHYLPVLNQLSNYSRGVMDFSSALEMGLLEPSEQKTESFLDLSKELERMQSVLENYTLTQEEQNRHELLRQEIESFIDQGKEVLRQHHASFQTVRSLSEDQRQIEGMLVQLIEQELGEVTRSTGLGVTSIEDIPATRLAAILSVAIANTQAALERYLQTYDEKERSRYEHLKSESRKHLDEYGKFSARREGGQRLLAILKNLKDLNQQLGEQEQQLLSSYDDQRNLLQELKKLSDRFIGETEGLIAKELEDGAKEKEMIPVKEQIFPRIELMSSLIQSVSESIAHVQQYAVIREPEAKEFYEAKILEILQDLDRLKGMLPEKTKASGESLDRLFQEIRVVANDLIETAEHFQNQFGARQTLAVSLQKTLFEMLDEEKERNTVALDRLEKKVAWINGVIIGVVLLIIVLGVTVIIYTSRAITRPIQELSQGAKFIGSGQLNYRIPLQTGDELEELAKEFNKMTHELQGLYTNLELKVEQRTRELAEVNSSLAESYKELDDFTYIVSHDLKEPLRGINAFSRFVLQDYGARLDPKAKEYLESIQGAAVRMTKLIENLLDLSRISRQRQPLEAVDVNQMLEEVRKNLIYALTEKNVDLRVASALPVVTCDRVRIQQVFHNLISNAIKYNDKQRPIIEIGCELKNLFYEFQIHDNGMGISKEHLDKVFKLFQRLPGSEKVEGTGAGLAIVKKIIEKHGGKIWLESEPEKGTIFLFTLPKEPVKSAVYEPVSVNP
ncbi:MAG: HAMP domain-containing protein [Candidatus Omnitrophica bacterium]|nr:HAMP domain-containing protein [Candidatus Omnitrophota bacterium]